MPAAKPTLRRLAYGRNDRALCGSANARSNAGHIETAVRELLRAVRVMDDRIRYAHDLHVMLDTRCDGCTEAVHHCALFDGHHDIVLCGDPCERPLVHGLDEARIHDGCINAFARELIR